MRILCIVLACGFVFALHAQIADPPVFLPPVFVEASGVAIDVGYYGSPTYFDWTGDGVKDLLVGQFSSGFVRLYPNSGTDTNPVFGGFTYLQADGRPISVYGS